MDPLYDLEEIDKRLTQYSYVCGYVPSKFDIDLSNKLGSNYDIDKYVHIKRWWYHMRSFSESEISLYPAPPPSSSINWSKDYKSIYENSNKNIDDQVCEKILCHNVELSFFFN